MSNESMTIREGSETFAPAKIVDVNTDLGRYEADDLRETLDELVSQKVQKIVVNLGGVQRINSTAVGTLVSVARQLREKDGDLKIYGLADNIQRTFDIIGAASILEIYDSESSALGSF